MEFEIKTYQPEYLEQQVALGEKIRSDWPLGSQTPLDQLKLLYNREDFDASTNFYAIADDKVIGFLTARISGNTAHIEFPIVEDNNGEIGKDLLDHAIDQFKRRGVSTIQARASPVWGKTDVYVQGYGFDLNRIELAQGTRLVRLLPAPDSDPSRSLDPVVDEELIRDIFASKLDYTQNHIDHHLKIINDDPGLVLDWLITEGDDSEITGHALVVNEPKGSHQAFVFHLYLDPTSPDDAHQFMELLLSRLDQEQLEYINIVLSGEQTSFMDLFRDMGFKFTKIGMYQLAI